MKHLIEGFAQGVLLSCFGAVAIVANAAATPPTITLHVTDATGKHWTVIATRVEPFTFDAGSVEESMVTDEVFCGNLER